MSRLDGKSIVMGVCGGIAAYKAAELVRLFGRQGASVQVVMTENARHFVTPLTLQVLSDRPVCCDLFDIGLESEIGHIQVGLILIALLQSLTIARRLAYTYRELNRYETTEEAVSPAPEEGMGEAERLACSLYDAVHGARRS